MIFHTRSIPFGIYHYPHSTDELARIVMAHEEMILRLESDWKNHDSHSPSSARYREYNFLTFPGTKDFKQFLHHTIDDYYRRLNWALPTHRWLQCWVNIHREGQHLKPHVHAGCKLSGHLTLACHSTRTTYFNQMTLDIENEPGLMTLIGREKVPHQTTPVEGKDIRISVAFDVFESSTKIRNHWVRLEADA